MIVEGTFVAGGSDLTNGGLATLVSGICIAFYGSVEGVVEYVFVVLQRSLLPLLRLRLLAQACCWRITAQFVLLHIISHNLLINRSYRSRLILTHLIAIKSVVLIRLLYRTLLKRIFPKVNRLLGAVNRTHLKSICLACGYALRRIVGNHTRIHVLLGDVNGAALSLESLTFTISSISSTLIGRFVRLTH